MGPTGARWNQFRRLLLGTVIELLQESGVGVSANEVSLRFSEESRFQVPRFDNYMRFAGEVTVGLTEPPTADALARLRAALARVWSEILDIVDIPIGDHLTSTRNDTSAEVVDGRLVIRFDLIAD